MVSSAHAGENGSSTSMETSPDVDTVEPGLVIIPPKIARTLRNNPDDDSLSRVHEFCKGRSLNSLCPANTLVIHQFCASRTMVKSYPYCHSIAISHQSPAVNSAILIFMRFIFWADSRMPQAVMKLLRDIGSFVSLEDLDNDSRFSEFFTVPNRALITSTLSHRPGRAAAVSAYLH